MNEEYLKKLVVALGGNAILQFGQRGTAQEQIINLKKTSQNLAPLIASWYQVVITHGNGPQVGNVLIQNDLAKGEVPAMPLDICGAQTQGQIGYMLELALFNELRTMGKGTSISAVLTLIGVNPNDPDFKNPSKPVGPWFTREKMTTERKEGETWIEHPQKGWRKVVPSPRPKKIYNSSSIETLLRNGHVVIACGGGGVPVVEDERGMVQGIEAVIDKDLASECLASEIKAHILMILTDVPSTFLNFGTPKEEPIGKISVEEMRRLWEQGIFPAGSIGPKVEAAIRFVENGGERAIIANLNNALEALKGKTGTIILSDNN